MSRATYFSVSPTALLHNVQRVKQCAPQKKIIAMVKANAYGCGLSAVVPVLEGHVDAFGVACIEEAQALRAVGSRSDCILFQGVFSADELACVSALDLQCVIHEPQQLRWILETPMRRLLKVWVKVDTGMHRLGFAPVEVPEVVNALRACTWIDDEIGLMTHFACADEPNHAYNHLQWQQFYDIPNLGGKLLRSMANSAAILALPNTHADVVRPGLMLYGVSPFIDQVGADVGLRPVIQFRSFVRVIHNYPPNAPIGYGGTWQQNTKSRIGVVAVGYADGYPRQIKPNTCVWINGHHVPIVGRVSMDMMTVNLTNYPDVSVGDGVELWGRHLPIERIAQAAGMIPYELLCHLTSRGKR